MERTTTCNRFSEPGGFFCEREIAPQLQANCHQKGIWIYARRISSTILHLKSPEFCLRVMIDVAIFILACISAYLLRCDSLLRPWQIHSTVKILPWLVTGKLIIFMASGMYQGVWRFVRVHEVWQLAQACIVSLCLTMVFSLYIQGLGPLARTLFPLDCVLTFIMIGVSRILIRSCHRAETCCSRHKTLPDIGHILNGELRLRASREINYEDLLGRPPVTLDTGGIRSCLSGGTIMVTGCGGSIGSELCRQLIQFAPKRLILIDANEANLFGIQMELHHEKGFRDYHCVLAHVQNRSLMANVFRNYSPDIVFHAAAYKHVPMMEKNPWEAFFNNVLGSQVTMELASAHKTKRFVLVSTDKAVRPTNIMGASKRVAELLMNSFSGNGTRFMAVRFGNVVGSSGSVVPLFLRQIERGGPVTVTHPEVTRYFMTIPEAAQLILQAGAMGNGREIFVLKMGTPVKIVQMAKHLIELSGRQPDREIEIIFTGLRPGEKLHEELFTEGEDVTETPHMKIMVLRSNGCGNASGHPIPDSSKRFLHEQIGELHLLALKHDGVAIKQKFKEILPEYTPHDEKSILESNDFVTTS